MSDFKSLLVGTTYSDGKTDFLMMSEEQQRHLAVVAALDLIKAEAASSYSHGGTSNTSSYGLERHMGCLSEYANSILGALKGEA
ncbi:hypothetical protein AB4425_17265 [Vibrio sp. 10N.261.51.A1]|uniref:hypothetical protein n=1 Tax=unclassified Vibrio TaxID=2614977 RepID=UPI00354DCE2B